MTLTNPSHICQGWVCWGPCDLHREEKLTAKDIFRSNEASLEISAAMELRKCSAGIRSDNVRLVETESKMDGGGKRRVLLITCCCFRCYDSLFSRWQRENIRTFLLFLFFFLPQPETASVALQWSPSLFTVTGNIQPKAFSHSERHLPPPTYIFTRTFAHIQTSETDEQTSTVHPQKTPAKICKHYLHNHTHASVNPNTLWNWSLGYSYLACNYTQFFRDSFFMLHIFMLLTIALNN